MNPQIPMNKIGLVTVLYNSDTLLPDFFNSIAIQSHTNYILYLVDNTPGKSTRETVAALNAKYVVTCVKHIECAKNIGAAEGNNIGIAHAIKDKCDYVILLNNDIYFANAEMFTSLLTLSVEKNLEIIAPKIYYAGSNKLWYAGGKVINWQAAVLHYGNTTEDTGQFNTSKFTQYAPTTFMLIKTELFSNVGEMDNTYFIYVEDLDYMYRAVQKGYKIWYEASLFLFHKVSSTTGGVYSNTGLFYTARNRVYFSKKYYSLLHTSFTVLYIFLTLTRHALLQKRASAVVAVLKGTYQGLKLKLSQNTSL